MIYSMNLERWTASNKKRTRGSILLKEKSHFRVLKISKTQLNIFLYKIKIYMYVSLIIWGNPLWDQQNNKGNDKTLCNTGISNQRCVPVSNKYQQIYYTELCHFLKILSVSTHMCHVWCPYFIDRIKPLSKEIIFHKESNYFSLNSFSHVQT
jgi:hypothetical protein